MIELDKELEELLNKTSSTSDKTLQLSNPLHTRIIAWNRVRNGLEFDPNLEIRMLSEEFNEFFMAETFAQRLQEFADIMFVWIGTNAKYYAQRKDRFNLTDKEHWDEFIDWFEGGFTFCSELIHSEMEENDIPESYLDKVLLYVVEANEAKGIEKVNGKVVKGPDYVSPLDRIEMDLERWEQ